MIHTTYKDPATFEGAFAVAWHPILIDLYLWVEVLSFEKIFTCCYEKRDYASVHSVDPLRGFDLRSRNLPAPEAIEEMTNRYWIYDPGRPEKRVCIYHNTGRGDHLHFQVHDNTIHVGPAPDFAKNCHFFYSKLP